MLPLKPPENVRKAKIFYVLGGLKANIGKIKAKIPLTHFNPMFHFYTPRKQQKNSGFLTFSGGKEMEHWFEMS